MTVSVKAVLSYRVVSATRAITNIDDYHRSTHLLAASSLRNVLGTKTLAEVLSERDAIAMELKVSKIQWSFCTDSFRVFLTKQLPPGV